MSRPERRPEMQGSGPHRSACTVGRFPADDCLRLLGFTLHARPRGSDALWRGPTGVLMTQTEALRVANRLEGS